jgi:hypothetical protein
MKPLRSRPVLYLLPAVMILAIVNVFLLVGWRIIDPTNVSWMRGDPMAFQIGWEFFRAEPQWNFPPLWTYRIGYPIGVSAAYFDSIPLLAILFRAFESLLPQNFQYMGLSLLISGVLQAYFGYALFSRLFRDDAWFAALAACFVVLAPVFLFRGRGHFALMHQWLIVAALSYYFDDRIRAGLTRYLLPFAILMLLAGGINPYLLLMVTLVGFAATGRLFLEHRAGILASCIAAAGLAAVGLTSLVLFGFLSTSASLAGGGYGHYSMNLLAPINPQGFDALLLKEQPIRSGQYEGYNYLGLGVILLLAAGVARAVSSGVGQRKALEPAILPLVVLFAVSLSLAVSYKVTFGPWQLYDFPWPRVVFDALSAFRASGRLFWPAHYLLIVAALVLAQRFMSRNRALALAGVMLVIQAIDISSLHSDVRARWRSSPSPALLQAEDWRTLHAAHAHLVIVPPWQCGPNATPGGRSGFDIFGRLAIDQKMTINSYYASRTTAEAREYFCKRLPEQLLSAGLDPGAAYILAPNFLTALVAGGQSPVSHFCRDVDGFVLCAKEPRRAGVEDDLLQRIFPTVMPGEELLFGPDASRGLILAEGWSVGERWGRWTNGPYAELFFRVPPESAVPLAVTMNVRAFVPRRGYSQRVRILIDDAQVAEWTFSPGSQGERTFPVPTSSIRPSGLVRVRFELPDAQRPIDVGVNRDTRLLGLGATSLRVGVAQ